MAQFLLLPLSPSLVPYQTMVAFAGAALMLAVVPGPDNIFVLTQSAMKGWRVGVAVTLGLCTGLIVHTMAVALGVAVIFEQSELAFDTLKTVGAGYLLYLAYGAFRARPKEIEPAEIASQAYGKMYARGLIMNVTNPKVAIFFLAFLPQFMSARKESAALQVTILGLIFIICALAVFSLISLLACRISERLFKSHRAQVMLNRTAGVVFLGLAAKLALSER